MVFSVYITINVFIIFFVGAVQNPDTQNPDRSKSRHSKSRNPKSRQGQNPDRVKIPTSQNPDRSKSRQVKLFINYIKIYSLFLFLLYTVYIRFKLIYCLPINLKFY